MPTYAYVCTECGHDFETVQAIADAALTACPQCGGRLRKVFHPVGVAFKGSGFYQTDTRNAAKAASDASKIAAAKSDSSSTSDAAPAKGVGDKGSSGSGGASTDSSKSSDSSKSQPSKRGASAPAGNNS